MKNFTLFKNSLITLGAASMLATAIAMTVSPSAGLAAALEAKIVNGIPVPTDLTSNSAEDGPFMVTEEGTVSASVSDVAEFYRSELAKLSWKEDKGNAKLGDAGGELRFISPEGPARLVLANANDQTQFTLTLHKAEAAKQSGLLPADGKTKVMFGNATNGEAVVNIDNKSVKIAAHTGEDGRGVPTLELKPGSFTY